MAKHKIANKWLGLMVFKDFIWSNIFLGEVLPLHFCLRRGIRLSHNLKTFSHPITMRRRNWFEKDSFENTLLIVAFLPETQDKTLTQLEKISPPTWFKKDWSENTFC